MQRHTNLGSQIAHQPQVSWCQVLATPAWGEHQVAQVLALVNQGDPCHGLALSAGAKGCYRKLWLSTKGNLLPLPGNGNVGQLEGRPPSPQSWAGRSQQAGFPLIAALSARARDRV